MKYLLIAGEASGDLHGARLIKALKSLDADASFAFLGGDLMAAEAGVQPAVHYREMAYMGFSEVLRHLGAIRKNMRTARLMLDRSLSAVILIDYPSFNLKIAKEAHKQGLRVIYYVSPKLWAWKSWRIKSIRKYVDKMLCIFPFEPAYYAERGYDKAVYVGNPSVEEIDERMESGDGREAFCERHKLRVNREILALLPGSREGEIRCNLPVMAAAAKQFPQYTPVIAGAPTISEEVYKRYSDFKVVRDDTYNLLTYAHVAVVTSGTATLETALIGTPQVVVYRSNGSKIAYNLMKRLLHVKFVSLPNLIVDKEIISELLLHHCTAETIAAKLGEITSVKSPQRRAMLANYQDMRSRLSTQKAAEEAAREIEERSTKSNQANVSEIFGANAALLSVVIPVYNRASIVERTLECIKAQTMRPLNLILVDNNSSDNSFEVLQRWKEKNESEDFMITILSEPRRGACRARNTGLAAVKTEWVAFFDSDDLMMPEHFAHAFEALQSNPEADLVAWHFLWEQNGKRSKSTTLRDALFNNVFHSTVCTQRYMARTELVRKVGGWLDDAEMFDDCELGTRLLLQSPTIVEVKGKPEVILCDTVGSIMNTSKNRLASMSVALQSIKAHLPEKFKHWADLSTVIMCGSWASQDEEAPATAHKIINAQPVMRRMLFCLLYRYTLGGGRGAARIYRLLTNPIATFARTSGATRYNIK